MPSLAHEEIVELFRSDPELAVELLRRISKIDLPSISASTSSPPIWWS